jgi:tetratricopeptide (TPR) repeat protein
VLINDEPEAGLVFLPLLALIGTPRAVEVLRKIAFGTFGTDELRAAALMELVELGEVQPEETTRIWSQGAWNEVQTCRIEVTTEPLYPLPEDLREDMDRFLESLRGRDWAAAEALGRSLLARAPDFPPLLHNLAQAFRAQGRREEAKALLRRALEIDPAYLFAPAALALMDLEQGRLAEARAVLAGVEMPSRAHADAFACFHLAQVEVALAEGNFEGAAAALSIVEDLRKRTGSALPGIGGWKARWIRLMAGKARRQQECDRGGRRGAPRGLHPPPGECAGRGEPPPGGGEARGA